MWLLWCFTQLGFRDFQETESFILFVCTLISPDYQALLVHGTFAGKVASSVSSGHQDQSSAA